MRPAPTWFSTLSLHDALPIFIFGVVPGPLVFQEKGDVIGSLFVALTLTSFVIFVVGLTVARHLAVVTLLPNVIIVPRSEEHTSELQSHSDLVCRLLLEKKNAR